MFHFKTISALLCASHFYRTLKQWMEKYALASDGKKLKASCISELGTKLGWVYFWSWIWSNRYVWGKPLSIWNNFAELKNSFIVGNLVECRFQFGKSRHCPWRLHSSQAPREVKAMVCVHTWTVKIGKGVWSQTSQRLCPHLPPQSLFIGWSVAVSEEIEVVETTATSA